MAADKSRHLVITSTRAAMSSPLNSSRRPPPRIPRDAHCRGIQRSARYQAHLLSGRRCPCTAAVHAPPLSMHRRCPPGASRWPRSGALYPAEPSAAMPRPVAPDPPRVDPSWTRPGDAAWSVDPSWTGSRVQHPASCTRHHLIPLALMLRVHPLPPPLQAVAVFDPAASGGRLGRRQVGASRALSWAARSAHDKAQQV